MHETIPSRCAGAVAAGPLRASLATRGVQGAQADGAAMASGCAAAVALGLSWDYYGIVMGYIFPIYGLLLMDYYGNI